MNNLPLPRNRSIAFSGGSPIPASNGGRSTHERPSFFLQYILLSALVLVMLPRTTLAHPMPNSLVQLEFRERSIHAALRLPLGELALAFGKPLLEQHPDSILPLYGKALESYCLQHVRATAENGTVWQKRVEGIRVESSENPLYGSYREVCVEMTLTPPEGAPVRDVVLHYDLILHQVVTHSALVSLTQDWNGGVLAQEAVELGVIAWDIRSNTLAPFVIRRTEGSVWQGLRRMMWLGMEHIAEGIDHILFLLVLLLPAPLLLNNTRWGGFGGIQYSLRRVLTIVTAFTIGHSLTLIIGALGLVRLPSQPVEVLIACSILVSAVHAVVPLLGAREASIAAGLGLVHGLAFASVLRDLHLGGTRLMLGILGFNFGIELMQLVIVAAVIPWLWLWSRAPSYRVVRIGLAVASGIIACVWVFERVSGQAILAGELLTRSSLYYPFALVFLAVGAIAADLHHRFGVVSSLLWGKLGFVKRKL